MILKEELDDYRFHNKYSKFMKGEDEVDLEAYKAFLEDYTPDKVEAISGVPAATLVQIARMFAESPATI